MDCYPGNPSGDPEEIAAANNMHWLGNRAGNERIAVFDIHSNNNKGLRFFEVGSRALQATMAGAYELGYDTCVVRPDSFYRSVPNSAALETPILNESEYHLAASDLCSGLRKIAGLGIDELQRRYKEIHSELTFLRKYVVTITPGDYDNQVLTVVDSHILSQLEAISPEPPFTEFCLSTELRQALSLSGAGRLLMAGWRYDNMSVALPDRGMLNGRSRKVALGGFFQEIEPPSVDGKWVEFKSPSHT